MLRLSCGWCVLAVAFPLVGQAPVLAPSASSTIDVDATFGHLIYASIAIPAGVVVQFTGSYPVRIEVHGDVRVDGELSVAPATPFPSGAVGGPGAVTHGAGWTGSITHYSGYHDPLSNQWVSGYSIGWGGQPGRHATLYGSALPFELAGGSPGGGASIRYVQMPWGIPQPGGGFDRGGGGGGTLTVEARGRIDIYGTVTADGGPALGDAGAGSGGSILLRGLAGCQVAAGGTVTAMPEGIVRLDAYDAPPQIAGSVQPTPRVVRLPDLAETAPPLVGSTWQLRVAAPRGDAVFLAASFQPGSGTTAYGTVGIDFGTAITFAVVTLPASGHDPLGTFELDVPNVPQLAGLNLWVQGLDWLTLQAPRYTQTVTTSVQ